MKPILIREYHPNDAAALKELLARLQDHLAKIDFLEQFIPYKDFKQDDYLKMQLESVEKKHGKIYLAEEEGALIAVLVGWIVDERLDFVEYYPNKIGYISDLYVVEEFRGQGIGEALVEKIEAYFKEQHCDQIALSYLIANEPAHRFYEGLGYRDYSARMVKRMNHKN